MGDRTMPGMPLVCFLLLLGTVAAARDSDDLSADYVIVGSGAAGSVTAGRLAQAGHSVLVLEAGPPTQSDLGGCSVQGNCPFMQGGERNLTIFDVPLEWLEILLQPHYKQEYEWQFKTDREGCLPSQARGVGGCGIHNAMIYIRGTPRDFTNDGLWGSMGWTWDRVLQAYLRTENNTDYGGGADPFHNKLGPVQISSVHHDAYARTSGYFMDACSSVTGTDNGDFNGVHRVGCGHYQFLIREGVRDSSAVSFLPPNQRAGGKGSITVRPYSFATRVLFERNSTGYPRAIGVEFVDTRKSGGKPVPGKPHTLRRVYARREVVISTGAANTPRLLMHSGIGSAAAVHKAGVPLVSELPAVGGELMDGVYAIMQFAIPSSVKVPVWEHCVPTDVNSSPFCQLQKKLYSQNRSGVYASPGLSSGAFLHSPYSTPAPSGDPDIQLTFHPWDKYSRAWTSAQRALAGANATIFSIEVSYNAAKSRGSVLLNKDDPVDPMAPSLFTGPYLLEEEDVRPLLWSLRMLRNLTKAFAVPTIELVPGAAMDDDEALEHYIRCGLTEFRPKGVVCDPSPLVVNHLAGTARMAVPPSIGSNASNSGVVDGELRVYGVANLRVADASVFPSLPSGNSHASCMMVGERAAEFLLNP